MRTHNNTNLICKSLLTAVLALTLSVSTGALATGEHSGGHEHGEHHGSAGHGHHDNADIGKPGKASEVTRTVTVTMTDYRYSIQKLEVKKGETIRFVLKNDGEFVHEFTIGTADMHKAHEKEMMMMVEHGVLEPDKINYARMKMKMPDGHTMEHDDPNSALVEPKKTAEIIWKFDTDAALEFACAVPGHYESGMVGKISVY